MPRTKTHMHTLTSLLATCLVVIVAMIAADADRAIAAEPESAVSVRRPRTFNIGNRDKPEAVQLAAISKSFCVAMRRDDGSDVRRLNLSDYISPDYMKKHNLQAGNLPMESLPVLSIFNIQLADDGQTALCIVNTKNSDDKHVLLLRFQLIGKNIYIDPVSAPNAQTGKFTPWVLKTKV